MIYLLLSDAMNIDLLMSCKYPSTYNLSFFLSYYYTYPYKKKIWFILLILVIIDNISLDFNELMMSGQGHYDFQIQVIVTLQRKKAGINLSLKYRSREEIRRVLKY